MGLFKADGNDLPEPRVTLQLDNSCETPFRPGSNVFGQVFFDCPIPRQIRDVQVSIKASTLTKYIHYVKRGNHPYPIRCHDEANLYEMKQVLAQGITSEPERRYCWDFYLAFQHGEGTLLHPNPNKSPYEGLTGHKDFYASKAYQLPPSFLHWKNDDHLAQVQYLLKVEVTFDDSKILYSPPIKILTYVPSQEPHQEKMAESVFRINSYSSSRLTGTSKSGLSRWKDKLTSSSPSVKLSLKSSIPSSIVRGKAFPIYAKLDVEPLSDPSTFNIPSVHIKILLMELVPLVVYRSIKEESALDYPFENIECPHEEETVEEGKSIALNAVPPKVDVEQQPDRKSPSLEFPTTFEGRLPGNVTPNFATSNIVLWYKLRVRLQANVCGKEIEDNAEMKIVVLSDVTS